MTPLWRVVVDGSYHPVEQVEFLQIDHFLRRQGHVQSVCGVVIVGHLGAAHDGGRHPLGPVPGQSDLLHLAPVPLCQLLDSTDNLHVPHLDSIGLAAQGAGGIAVGGVEEVDAQREDVADDGFGGVGADLAQNLCRLAHAAAAGGGEWDDGLAGEATALQEGLHDIGCLIPPELLMAMVPF